MYEKLPSYGRKAHGCDDCGSFADAPMMRDTIWLEFATRKTSLCCGCLEIRMGRPFTAEDLRVVPMNGALLYYMDKVNARPDDPAAVG